MSEQPTIPGEHEVEPDLDIDQENPDLELPGDDDEVVLEGIADIDLPKVDPHADDEVVLDEEN